MALQISNSSAEVDYDLPYLKCGSFRFAGYAEQRIKYHLPIINLSLAVAEITNVSSVVSSTKVGDRVWRTQLSVAKSVDFTGFK